jgi:hypothetical protein
MTKIRGVTGGGIDGNKVIMKPQPKVEPTPHAVSVGAVARLGQAQYPGAKTGPLYEGRGYAAKYNATTPSGPTSGLDCRPGGNGREILRAGTQSATPAAKPTIGPPGRSLFR